MVRLVIRLSIGAKIAATVAMLGGGATIYARLEHIPWLGGVGTVMLFGGTAAYFVERVRMWRLHSKEQAQQHEREHRPLSPRHDDYDE